MNEDVCSSPSGQSHGEHDAVQCHQQLVSAEVHHADTSSSDSEVVFDLSSDSLIVSNISNAIQIPGKMVWLVNSCVESM